MRASVASSFTPALPLVVARVYLGITLLGSDHGNGSPGEMTGVLNFALQNGQPWYRGFIAAVVLPHAALFATLVTVTEIAVGVALVLGVATRLAGVVAIVLFANYWCAKGAMPWTPIIDGSDMILAALLIAGAAGRRFGVDAFLHERFPKVRLW